MHTPFPIAGLVLVAAGITLTAGCSAVESTSVAQSQSRPAAQLTLSGPSVHEMIAHQQALVERFFGGSMPREFAVHVFAHRPEMVTFAQQTWEMPELPCWAVAMGSGSTLAVLSPSAWKTEACDHAGDDAAAIERIIAHELVHVFHGQHRPADPEFNHADDVGWFVEGLAVYASGQLDAARLQQAGDLVVAGKAPAGLSEAWAGPARYAVAGSMVRLVDQRLGRARLKSLLSASTSAQVLAAMGMSEDQFLAVWRDSMTQ